MTRPGNPESKEARLSIVELFEDFDFWIESLQGSTDIFDFLDDQGQRLGEISQLNEDTSDEELGRKKTFQLDSIRISTLRDKILKSLKREENVILKQKEGNRILIRSNPEDTGEASSERKIVELARPQVITAIKTRTKAEKSPSTKTPQATEAETERVSSLECIYLIPGMKLKDIPKEGMIVIHNGEPTAVIKAFDDQKDDRKPTWPEQKWGSKEFWNNLEEKKVVVIRRESETGGKGKKVYTITFKPQHS